MVYARPVKAHLDIWKEDLNSPLGEASSYLFEAWPTDEEPTETDEDVRD